MSKYSKVPANVPAVKKESLDFRRMADDLLANMDMTAILTDVATALDLQADYPDGYLNIAKGALKAACDRWSAIQREKSNPAYVSPAVPAVPALDPVTMAQFQQFQAFLAMQANQTVPVQNTPAVNTADTARAAGKDARAIARAKK